MTHAPRQRDANGALSVSWNRYKRVRTTFFPLCWSSFNRFFTAFWDRWLPLHNFCLNHIVASSFHHHHQKMKTGPIIAAALLHTWSGVASIIQVGNPSVRVLPRALIPRAGRDCGKFVMFCEKAAGACNNACYHINCIDETSKTMVYATLSCLIFPPR